METAPEKAGRIRRAAEEIGIALPAKTATVLGVFVLLRTIGGAGKGTSGGSLRDQNGKALGADTEV